MGNYKQRKNLANYWFNTSNDLFASAVVLRAAMNSKNDFPRTEYDISEVFDTDPTSGIKIHKQKAYVGGVMIHTYTQSDDPALIAEHQGGKFADIQYLHHDHLGSTQTITDGTGAVLQNLAFDPFGKARQSNWESLDSPHGQNPNWNDIALNNTSTGFTGHEMLAAFTTQLWVV